MTIKLDKKLIDQLQKLRIGVIGDTIIDAYQFVDPIGKSSKSPTITANLLHCEYHAGGVLAIANHIGSISNSISLLTLFGNNAEIDSVSFSKSNLHKNIKLDYVQLPYKPTTLKKRFVDNFLRTNKLLEVFEYNENPIHAADVKKIVEKINTMENECDVILVADFGHGMFENETIIKRINSVKKHLCLMVQTNSLNYGFNLITKFRKCDYFCIDKREADLASQNKKSNYEDKIARIARRMKAGKASITMGKDGCLILDKQSGIVQCPNISNKNTITDTVGAGDAFFAITSLLSYLKIKPEVLGYIGNQAGYFATQYLGNEKNLVFNKN